MSAATVPVTGATTRGTTVDCSNFRSNPVELVSGLVTLYAIVNPVDQLLTAELVYKGQGWLSLAFTQGGFTQMLGAEAVIGVPAMSQVSATNPGKYDLRSKDPSGVVLMDASHQTLTNAKIMQNSTHAVLTFTKPLVESGEYDLSATDANTVLWAVGGSNELLFHIRRGDITLKFHQCTVTSDTGVVMGTDSGAGVVSVSDDNHSMWVAHGMCAAIAWAILVPLAVGASIIRSLLEFMGLPKGMWFQIHRGLNMIAAILTICSFSIAVYLFNEEPGAVNFTELTHHTLGLIIFILTLLQAISGICRPHLPHPNLPTVRIDGNYESNQNF